MASNWSLVIAAMVDELIVIVRAQVACGMCTVPKAKKRPNSELPFFYETCG